MICWICDNDYIKVGNHCHIAGKNRGSAHRDYNINVKLNHKIPAVFHNLKKYDPHLIILITQELGKFNLKINVIPNGLERYMSINNKLSFIDNFQLPSSSLDSLVKNLSNDDFKYLSQEFDNNELDLVKQKGFDPYEYINNFERFKEQLPSKEKFYSSLTGKKIMKKNMNMFLGLEKN